MVLRYKPSTNTRAGRTSSAFQLIQGSPCLDEPTPQQPLQHNLLAWSAARSTTSWPVLSVTLAMLGVPRHSWRLQGSGTTNGQHHLGELQHLWDIKKKRLWTTGLSISNPQSPLSRHTLGLVPGSQKLNLRLPASDR